MDGFYQANPFVQHLDMRIVRAKVGEVELEMMIQSNVHTNVYGIAHGGALMSLSDTAMGAACLTMQKKVVTIDMNINCMKAVPAGEKILAVGQIISNGNKIIVAEAEIKGEDGKIYAKSRGSFFVTENFSI